jgi:hypothetical protein
MGRNLSEVDVAVIIRIFRKAAEEGKNCKVFLKGTEIAPARISKYIKKKKTTEDSLLASINIPAKQPHYITHKTWPREDEPAADDHRHHGLSPHGSSEVMTPSMSTPPSQLASSDFSRVVTPTSVLSPRSSQSSVRAEWSQYPALNQQTALQGIDTRAIPEQPVARQDDPMIISDDETGIEEMVEVDNSNTNGADVEMMSNRLLNPGGYVDKPWTEPSYFRQLSVTPQFCNKAIVADRRQQPTSQTLTSHSTSSDRGPVSSMIRSARSQIQGTSSGHEESAFLSRCIDACISQGKGLIKNASNELRSALGIFRWLVENRPDRCLTTLNVLLSTLEAHGHREMAQDILSKALDVVRKMALSLDLVAPTIEFMLEIVSGQTKLQEYNTATLWAIHDKAALLWTKDSPSTLTALYHVAWNIATDPAKCDEAWEILRDLRPRCELIFGPHHPQTVTCMITESRTLHNQGKQRNDIELLNKAAILVNEAATRSEQVFEEFHPYRLELQSRQARILMEFGPAYDVERILRQTLEHQVDILGLDNPRTKSTIRLLQKFLNNRGKEEEANRLPEKLMKERQREDPIGGRPM